MATRLPHPSLGALKAKQTEADGSGLHFTWILSGDQDFDVANGDDGDQDSAMVELDEEMIHDGRKNGGQDDLYTSTFDDDDDEEDDDLAQLNKEDMLARAEYESGPKIVPPNYTHEELLQLGNRRNPTLEPSFATSPPSCLHKTLKYVPCGSCFLKENGKPAKVCSPSRMHRKTKRFCVPNYKMLKTLRIVKHVRVFTKIFSGTPTSSYFATHSPTVSHENPGELDLEIKEESPLNNSANNNLNDSPRRKTIQEVMDDTSIELEPIDTNHKLEEPVETRKPGWRERRIAAAKRVKDLSQDVLSNIKPGVVTAFINFPLVLAVAGGVGAHPYLGLNAAFWSALAAALFGGSRFTIAAPTMLLTANLVDTVNQYGTFVLPVIALLAAFIIFTLLFTRVHELITFVPSMTTHGVTLGTTALVIIYQLKFALGLHGDIHASSVPWYIKEVLILAFTNPNWWAILMFSVSMVISYAMIKWGRGVPVAIVTVPLGLVVSWILDLTLQNQGRTTPFIETLGTRYGHIEFHPVLVTHWQAALFNWDVLGKAMQVAFICVMESYATANMSYELTGKRFSKEHEMFTLGTANLISGLFGGMPTSVGVTRTLLSIRSGATSRAAGLINGICLLIFAATMTSWLRYMPLPVVASLQITSAWRSVDTAVWAKVWKTDPAAAGASLTAALLCVIVNPFIGLLIGIIISMSIFSRALSKGHSELTVKTKVHRTVAQPSAPASPAFTLRSSRVIAVPDLNIRTDSISRPSGLSSSQPNIPKRLHKLDRQHSLADVPASKAMSLRNAVAQLQPLLAADPMEREEEEYKYNVVVYRISGVLTFINAQTHFENLKAITKNNVACLILNVRFLYYADYDGKGVLARLVTYIDEHLPLPTYLVGVTSYLAAMIKKEDWYKKKRHENLIWALESDAFKDIQLRNAMLISGMSPSTSTAIGLDIKHMEVNSSPSRIPSTLSTSTSIPVFIRQDSKSVLYDDLPLKDASRGKLGFNELHSSIASSSILKRADSSLTRRTNDDIELRTNDIGQRSSDIGKLQASESEVSAAEACARAKRLHESLDRADSSIGTDARPPRTKRNHSGPRRVSKKGTRRMKNFRMDTSMVSDNDILATRANRTMISGDELGTQPNYTSDSYPTAWSEVDASGHSQDEGEVDSSWSTTSSSDEEEKSTCELPAESNPTDVITNLQHRPRRDSANLEDGVVRRASASLLSSVPLRRAFHRLPHEEVDATGSGESGSSHGVPSFAPLHEPAVSDK